MLPQKGNLNKNLIFYSFLFITSICQAHQFHLKSEAVEQVDLIELNHFYDEHGRLVFDQLIFWDWSNPEARYNVRTWRLVKNPNMLPEKNWQYNIYISSWLDGEIDRKIFASEFKETWLQYDVELQEREYLPKEKRKDFHGRLIKR